jgi:6-phosphofructokinase
MKRIAVLTGGGDAPGLNAVIRAGDEHGNGVRNGRKFGISFGMNNRYSR